MGDSIHCSRRMVETSVWLFLASLIGTSFNKHLLIKTEDYDDDSDFGKYTTKRPKGEDYFLGGLLAGVPLTALGPILAPAAKKYAKDMKSKSLAELLDLADKLKPDAGIGELKDDIL